jgi:hypothetical protein
MQLPRGSIADRSGAKKALVETGGALDDLDAQRRDRTTYFAEFNRRLKKARPCGLI